MGDSDRGMTFHGLKVIGFIVFLLFLPLVGGCMWSVWKDPITPHLVRELRARVREMCCGRKKRSKKNKST